MRVRTWQNVGLFLAMCAAFSLAFGYQHAAVAGGNASLVEQTMSSEQGKAALEKAGVTPEQFATMYKSLTPEQKSQLESMVRDATPRAILSARMMEQGYTQAEAAQRLALLSNEEVARLAGNPDSTASGGAVEGLVFVLCLVLVAILVAWYFVAVESPEQEPGAGSSTAPALVPVQ